MKYLHVPFLAALLLSTVACSGESGDDDASDAGTGGTGTSGAGGSGGSGGSGVSGTSPGGAGGGSAGTAAGSGGSSGTSGGMTILANKVNNYSFSSTLTLPPIAVKPDSDLTIDWSAVTKDFMGHDVVASTVNVMLFELPLDELQTKMNSDDLKSKDAQTPVQVHITDTQKTAQLFDFLTAADDPLEPEQILPYFSATMYPPEANTYTVILADGTLSAGGQARMLQSFKLDPASTNTTVALTNTSTMLTYEVDLHSLQPTLVPVGDNKITIDWGDTDLLPTNSLGREFLPQQILEVRIAHYTETPAELETKFLDLELIATESYEAPVSVGVSLAFDQLKTSTGTVFPGITADGTWMLALVCTQCRNPAPWYLTFLKPM